MAAKQKVGQIKATQPRFEYVDDGEGEFDGVRFYSRQPQQEPVPEKSSAWRGVSDSALALGQGVVGGVKMLSDLAGPDNSVSETLGKANAGMQGLYSPERTAEMRNRQALIQAADDSGSTVQQITSRLGGIAEAPLDTTLQAAGSMAPNIAAAIATGGVSAGPSVLATAARFGVPAALGVGMGVGSVKGQNYDAVLQKAKQSGMSDADAQALAVKASEYSAANAPQQALGGALGVLDSMTGAERFVSGMARKGVKADTAHGAIRRGVMGGLEEAGPEGLQGAQGQYAQNEALNNAGFKTDPWTGVVGQGVNDAVVGSMVGAPVGVMPDPVPEVGPLSKAANVGIAATGPIPVEPPPMPLAPEQEQSLLALANARNQELTDKANGTKDVKTKAEDGTPVTIPGKQPEFLTPAEKEEQAFLAENGGDVQALARAYPGVLAQPAEQEQQRQQPETSTSRGNDGDNAGAGVESGATDGNGVGANPRGAVADSLGQSGEQAGGSDAGAVTPEKQAITDGYALDKTRDSGVRIFRKTDDAGRHMRAINAEGELITSTSNFGEFTISDSYLDYDGPQAFVVSMDNKRGHLTAKNKESGQLIELSPRADKEFADGIPLAKVLETEFSDAGGIKPDGSKTPHTTTVKKSAPTAKQKSNVTTPVAPAAESLQPKPFDTAAAIAQYRAETLAAQQAEAPSVDELFPLPAAPKVSTLTPSPTAPTSDALPVDIKHPTTGKPFTTKPGAMKAQKLAGDGHEVVKVDGGFVVRAKDTNGPSVQAPGLDQPAATGSSDKPGGSGVTPVVEPANERTGELQSNPGLDTSSGQTAPVSPASTGTDSVAPGDWIKPVVGSDKRPRQVDSVGKDGWVYTKSGDSFKPGQFEPTSKPVPTPITGGTGREQGDIPSGNSSTAQLPPTDIRIGDTVRKDGKDYTVTQGIDGGVAATRTVSAQNGVTQEKTIFLKGDEAIRAKLEAASGNSSTAADENPEWTRLPHADRLALNTRAGMSKLVADKIARTPWADITPKTREKITAAMAAPVRSSETANAPVTDKPSKPEIVVDKAEMRPYRKPDGSVGYEAVPIQEATPAADTPKTGAERLDERIKSDVANKPGTVNVPSTIAEAFTSQMQKQKGRITRLKNEAEKARSLEDKRAAQLKVTAAEATLRQMRLKIFEAEDAAVKAVEAGDVKQFAQYADLFPSAAEEIAKLTGQNDELDAEMQSYEAKANPTYSGAPAIRQKLETIAQRLGFSVNKSTTGWHASGGMISIPSEDADLSSAVSADHVFAHELGHGIMDKRGVSVKGFPDVELRKRVANWDELVAASKEFRPGVHNHTSDSARKHAKKANEIAADAIASVLIGDKPLTMLQPFMDWLGINKVDLGLQTVDEANAESRAAKESESKAPQAPAEPTPAATENVAKPDAKAVLSEREKAAKAKMFNALGKLATLAGKNTRMNWTQEEEQQLLPIVIELFDGAMELGAVTFQQAVAYVREFISSNLDQETADAIPFDTLQGAYISVAGRHKDKGVTSKKEVVSFESLAELENSADKAEKAPVEVVDEYDENNLDESEGRDGWKSLTYVSGDDDVSYPVDFRDIRTSKEGSQKVVRQIRIYNPNSGSYMAVWEWRSAKLTDDLFAGLSIDQAVFHYSLSDATEAAFGKDADNGDALWARYGREITSAVAEEKAQPASPAKTPLLAKPEAKADTSAKPSLNGPEGRHAIAQSVADHFIGGGKFDTIIQARKFISELTGEKIESSSKNAKLADETIEMGVVLAGREMVKAGRNQKRSDQTIYDRLVSLYNAQPNLSVRSSTSVEQQAYSTPIPLAFVASRLAKIKKGDIVAEPTAGNSALVLEVLPAHTVINELNDDRIGNLKAMGFTPTQKNAATEQLAAPKSVDAAVMNPPFGAVKDGEGKTIYFDVPAGPNTPALNTREIDHAIVFNSLATIKDDGRAVLIVGGVDASSEDQIREGYRGNGKREFYYKLYNEYKVTDHFTVDGGLYSRQGAGYPVDVIVIDGRGKSARDLPAANLPQRIMSYDQLKEKLNEANSLVPAGSGTGVRVGSDPARVSHGTDVATSSIGSPDVPGIEGVKPGASIQAGSKGDGVRPILGQSAGSGSVSGGGKLGATGTPTQPDGPARGGLVAPAGVSGESGRKAGNGGNRSDDVGGNSSLDGKLVGSGLTDRRGQEAETENQVGYTPKSGKASVGTLVPVNMRDAIQESLSKVADDVGDLDDYVAKALGYTSQELGDYLSAEQIDALALAIYNAEQGKGFIIGDQTGIGKGRVNAAMIRYAIKKGQVPIFITEKPNLYADMIRDLDDIGMAKDLDLEGGKPHILMTNNGESIPYELYRNVNGEVVEHKLTLKAPKSNAKDAAALLAELAGNGELGRYKVIFSTYSQLQSIAGKATERQRFLTAFAKDNFIIFDESHNAGGTGEAQDSRAITKVMKASGMTVPGRAGFARNLVKLAKGTFFSSATYAKRPDVMDLYSSTNMSLAVDKPADLATAIKAGGVPLQQAVATMLTADGQYIRRERTFAGVSYETQLMPIDRQTGENMAESMRWILAFSRAKEALLAQMQKEFDKDGAIAQNMGGEKTQVAGANFGSVMHNLIDQMLLALKVEESVKLAIAKLKSGEKVVLTVSNTMGSFLKDYADEMGIRPGDAVSLSFKDLYLRYLDKQRKYKVRSPGGTVEEKYLSDAELGHLLPMHNKIQAFIQNAGFGSAPISPIDYMHNELRKAGYKTDEITGRTATVDYEGGIAKLASRTANIKQRLKAIGDFNSGAADVLILNQSGSTGLSLHASAKFKDQKKRHMIIVQAEKNIDTHMQMLGRVHRTGQVVTPGYTQAMADTPAEMRPAAVLSKKMAGLSANTTASRKSAVAAEGVVDFINEYGGQVAAEFLLDNPEVHDALGGQRRIEVPSDLNEAGEELIRKLTGYIPILPLKQQEQIYADLIERYNDLIARENSMGTNRLETKALDLDAKTLTSEKITANKGSATETSVFAEPANMELVDVKRNVKPLNPQELEAAINETLNGVTPQQYNTSIAKEFDADLAKYVADVLEKMAVTTDNHALVQGQKKDQLFLMGQNIKRVLSIYKVGDSVTITDKNASVVHGVITGITHNQKTKNPAAGSAWKMTFALANGDARTMSVGFGQLGQQFSVNVTPGTVPQITADGKIDRVMIRSLFEQGTNIRREKRWMVTGNLLAGFSKYQGQIVSYTKADGGTGQGVLMNRQFDYKKEKGASTLSFSTSAQAIEFLAKAGRNAVVGSPDRVLRIVSLGSDRYSVMVPSSRREGGSLYLDRGLLDAFGTDFYKQGQNMSMRIDGNDTLERGLNYLIAERDDISLSALTNQDVARKVLGMDDAPPAVFSQNLVAPKSSGPKPTLEQIQGFVEKILQVAKNVIPVSVIASPHEIAGVKVPVGTKPTGAVIDGRIYLFADNIGSVGSAYVTLFHEVFHLGLQKVIPAEDYAAMLKQFAKSPLVAKYIRLWKDSAEGVQKAKTMPSQNYEALANEEALAMVSETLAANDGMGTKNLPGLAKLMLNWLAKVADRIGMPVDFSNWVRDLTRTEAERFVNDMVRAVLGGQKNLTKTQAKYKTEVDGLGGVGTRFSTLGGALTSGMNSVREVGLPAGYKVADLFQGEGRLSYWHKSVGTMYNLAQRSPPFKRVFDSVQNFLNDVSFYAAEAADLAPSILPKLDKITDIAKSPLSAADTKALSRPVFEGTLTWGRDSTGTVKPMEEIEAALEELPLDERAHMLLQGRHVAPAVLRMWQGLPQDQYEAIINGKFEREFMKPGVVFTPSELREHFGMSDAQVALYQEFRKATDKSIDNLAISEMLNYAGKDALPVREAVLASGSVQEAGQTLRDYLVSLTEGESSSTFDAEKVAKARVEANKLRKEADAIEAGAGNRTSQKVSDLEKSISAEEDKAVALGKAGKLTEADAVMNGVKALEGKLTEAKRSANGRDYAIAANMRKQADSLMEDALASTTEQTKRYDSLTATAAKMLDIAAHATDMKDRGYAPLSRFGNYTLEATLPTGERYFSLFETDRERNKMARMLTSQGATGVSAGTMSQEAYKLLNGITPETAALFGEMLGLESQGSEAKDLAFQEYIKRGTANRSAMKRLLQRKGIAGFSEDSGRVLAGFIYSNSRRTSSNLHAKETTEAVSAIPKEQGELKDTAVKLHEYVSNPAEEAQAFRGLLFAQYLGGSVASAMVNATQPFTVTLPYLTQFGGVKKAAAQMVAAVRDATKDTTGNAALDAALKKAEEEGIVSPQEVHSLQAQAMGRAQLQAGDGTTMGNALAMGNNAISKMSLAWGKVFGLAEQFNRRTTFIAAYRTAIEQGIANPAKFAEKAVMETQFVYNKGNKPRWGRGAIGATLFTFKQYSVNYLEMVHRMATAGEPGSPERAAGRKAAVLAIAILFMLAGSEGLPFVEDIEDVLDGAMQRLGYNFSSKQRMKAFLVTQLGKDGAEFVTSGVSGLPGAPIDVSGRLGMGNLIPGTGLFQKKTDHTRDLMELLGPTGDFAKRTGQATEQLLGGNVVGSVKTIAPTALRNLDKAYDMTKTGMYRDDKGGKIIDTDGFEAVAKAIGFQPRSVKNVQDASREVQKAKAQYTLASGEIRAKMAQAIFMADEDMKQDARDDVIAWNRNNPDQRMTIDMPTVLRKVREMRKSKEQRIADTAPKALRSQVREQLRGELH